MEDPSIPWSTEIVQKHGRLGYGVDLNQKLAE